jgi:hypothetical protein
MCIKELTTRVFYATLLFSQTALMGARYIGVHHARSN